MSVKIKYLANLAFYLRREKLTIFSVIETSFCTWHIFAGSISSASFGFWRKRQNTAETNRKEAMNCFDAINWRFAIHQKISHVKGKQKQHWLLPQPDLWLRYFSCTSLTFLFNSRMIYFKILFYFKLKDDY